MLGFLCGLFVGAISGGFTYHETGDGGLATIVGIIVFLLAWLIGLFVFTDGTDFDF
jgi:hypothetical protein